MNIEEIRNNKKKWYKKWYVWVIIILVILLLGSLPYATEEIDGSVNNVESKNISKESNNTMYKKRMNIADFSQNYIFAIENENFEGDVLQSGTYSFSFDLNEGQTAPVIDIYVGKKEYNSIDDLISNNDPKITIGGINPQEEKLKLKKDDYIYLIPDKNSLNYDDVGGILKIKKID